MTHETDISGDAFAPAAGQETAKTLMVKYAKAFSGDGARVFIQLIYFYLVANALTIGEFGLFATASSIGIVLSRLSGFGFLSPLYRIATVKPHLLGTYTSGYIAAVLLSLPVVAIAGAVMHAIFFRELVSLPTFALIAGTEILAWRTLEVVININKGLERFGRASLVIIFGFSMKALAALWLASSPAPDLDLWGTIYAITQTVMALAAITLFYPRVRLRFRPKLYRRRIPDALSVSGAEILFYVQSELDKLVVLSIGGPAAAGLYAIVMRLVDLTAMPVRTFSTILTQRLMRRPGLMDKMRTRITFEAGVFAISTLGVAAMAFLLWLKPDLLGNNVAEASPLMALVLLVPAFRNLVEYQAELLYGRGQSFQRLVNYTILGVLKAVLLVWLMQSVTEASQWALWLNAVFGALYAVSFALTYRALAKPAIRI